MAFNRPKQERAVPEKTAPRFPKAKALPPPKSAVTVSATAEGALDGDLLSPLNPDIPPHVWAILQSAGETAAARLLQILQSPRFPDIAPSAQRGLIELALTRAYGLPIRKALNLNLSSNDADAVAASLADLGDALPEHVRHAMRQAATDSPNESRQNASSDPSAT
jgi:hypothetical protein